MSERILVPYDGSTPAEEALEYAFETFPEAEVTALYVVPTSEGYFGAFEGAEGRREDLERAEEYGHDVLEEATAIAAKHDRSIETDLATGRPHHEIVDRAAEGGYDAVVIGSHGREGVPRVLLGSVAEKVVRRSPTPVFVVR